MHVEDPSADVDDLGELLEYTQQNVGTTEDMVIEIQAMDQNKEDLTSALEVDLPRDTHRDDVLPRLDRCTKPPPHTDILVRASDGSALSGFDGLPTAEDRAIWSELASAPYSQSYGVEFGPLNIEPGTSQAAMVILTLHKEPSDAATRDARRVAFMTAQLRTLNEHNQHYHYYVDKGSSAAIQLDQRVCEKNEPKLSGWRGVVAQTYSEWTCKKND